MRAGAGGELLCVAHRVGEVPLEPGGKLPRESNQVFVEELDDLLVDVAGLGAARALSKLWAGSACRVTARASGARLERMRPGAPLQPHLVHD